MGNEKQQTELANQERDSMLGEKENYKHLVKIEVDTIIQAKERESNKRVAQKNKKTSGNQTLQ